MVGRTELREETRVCFSNPGFRARPPFPSPAPPAGPGPCLREELWSRGLLSLGAVRQLRVTLPFGGSASALGLKGLAVWGQPARCCPAAEVERLRGAQEAGERPPPRPTLFAASSDETPPPLPLAATCRCVRCSGCELCRRVVPYCLLVFFDCIGVSTEGWSQMFNIF